MPESLDVVHRAAVGHLDVACPTGPGGYHCIHVLDRTVWCCADPYRGEQPPHDPPQYGETSELDAELAGLSTDQEIRVRALEAGCQYGGRMSDALRYAELFAAWIRDGQLPDTPTYPSHDQPEPA